MKLLRIGEKNREKPAILDNLGKIRDLSGHINDLDCNNLNFGTIEKGEIISRYITFKNDGKRDLVISNVKSSCGCTIADWPKNPIAPNHSDSILLVLNTSSLNGKIMKTVTIISNSKPNTKVITINAQIN